jgi:hypothetical protein
MSLRLLLILCGLLGGCATIHDDTPPTCDGRDRRPANPYGSILLPSQSAPTAAPTAADLSSGGCA